MINVEMNLSSYISFIQAVEMILLLFYHIYYGFCLDEMLVIFGNRIFNLFKYGGSMSLISQN